MSRDPNPYEPPPAEPTIPMTWDRCVLAQIGFGIHMLVLIAYSFITVNSDQPPSSILAAIDPRFNIAMAVCCAVGFALVFAMTITETAWPFHQRSCLIGVDLLLIGFLAYISLGFGTLCR